MGKILVVEGDVNKELGLGRAGRWTYRLVMLALLGPLVEVFPSVGIRGHMGHIGTFVVAIRRLSRKMKTLVAGPSPTSPMKAKIIATSISFKF